MQNNLNITCPVSADRVDESVTRLIASYVVIATTISIVFNIPFIAGFLAIDFFIRSFVKGNTSLVRHFAKQIAGILRLPKKPTDAAPKKFAASLGFLFSTTIVVLQFLQYYVAAKIVGIVLITCAVLEAGFSFCIGCIVYTLITTEFQKKQTI